MSGLDKVTNGIYKAAAAALGAVSKSKPMKKLGNAFTKNPEKALALTTVGSIVVKDGIGCYKYVTQSLNNKKIPEERRGFVAALDLTNGVLMIAAQIAMFAAMRKFSGPIFEKLFKKSFNPNATRDLVSKIRMEQFKSGENAMRKIEIMKEHYKVKENALGLFKFIADIAAATIVGKRIIVPFIATPLAKVVQGKMESRQKNKQAEKDLATA